MRTDERTDMQVTVMFVMLLATLDATTIGDVAIRSKNRGKGSMWWYVTVYFFSLKGKHRQRVRTLETKFIPVCRYNYFMKINFLKNE